MEKVSKILSILAIVIGVVAFILVMQMANAGDEAMKASPELQAQYLTPLFTMLWIVLGVAVVSVVAFSIIEVVKDPSKLKKVVINLVIVGAIFGIAYSLSSDTPVTFVSGETSTAEEAKWTDVGLYTFYIMFGMAALSVVSGGLFKLARK